MTDFDWLQIEQASNGRVPDTLAEWPGLSKALRLTGITISPGANAEILRAVCRGLTQDRKRISTHGKGFPHMGKEASYIRAVNKFLPLVVHSEGMANPYRGGTPDRYYEGPEGHIWVEYKFFEKLPPTIDLLRSTEKTKPMLSALQQEWLVRANRNKQSVAVIVGSPEGGVIFPGQSWKVPITRKDFPQLARPKKDIAHWIERCVCGGVR